MEPHQPDLFHDGQFTLLERIATDAPLDEILHEIVQLVERQAAGMLCTVLRLDPVTHRVRTVAAPSVPQAFARAIDGLPIGPRAGSCGRAAYLKEPVVSEDIETDPNWHDYKHLALPHGLRACWSTPILSPGNDVLGTFAMYYRERRVPSKQEVEWVEVATHLASIAIRHELTQQSLRDREWRAEQSEERLRAVIENAPNVAIQWFDVNGRVMFANAASLALFGWTRNSAIGRTLGELNFDVDESDRFTTALTSAMQTGTPVGPIELHFRRADATDGVLVSTVFRIPFEAGAFMGVGMSVDITESRRLETQLQQAQRIQALGTLAGGIAHDFSNILSAIRGHADLALMEPMTSPPVHESLQEISRASRRASDLVRRILTFSRHDAPRREVLAVADVVDEAVKLLRPTILRNVDIVVRHDGDVPLVLADPTQLHQIVMNLGTNAAYAMRGTGGVVDIAIDAVEFAEHDPKLMPDLTPGRYARIRVTDSGTGMDQATLARVFEPFFTTKPIGEGTGLGLSVVYGIVKNHGGSIQIDSIVGEGTTITMCLPVTTRVRIPTPVTPRTAMRAINRHIMYVDDDEVLVKLASRVLLRYGYRVTGHSNPVRALEDFQSRPHEFDAVVTDLSMPVLNGVDLATKVLAVNREMPVVLVSGYVSQLDAERARSLGLDSVIAKPQTIHEFADLLRERLDARQLRG